MRWPHHVVFACVLVILLGAAAPGTAQQIMKHSGVIVSIADDAKTFVLAEVGPWSVRDGVTVTYRTITLAPGTTFAIAGRVREAPSGFPGDFVQTPVGPELVFLSDYVTVECRHERERLVALTITVTELPTVDEAPIVQAFRDQC